MATLTVYSSTADGVVKSNNATYTTMIAGSNLTALTVNSAEDWGQENVAATYFGATLFLDFDTSALGVSATLSAASLSIYGAGSNTDKAHVLQARGPFDWSGGGLTTADWRTGGAAGQFAALTLLATYTLDATASQWSTVAYNDFTESGTNLQSNIDKTGTTYMALCNDDFAAGNAPSGPDRQRVTSWMADAAGTTQDPKLVVTYTPAPSGGADSRRFLRGTMRGVLRGAA